MGWFNQKKICSENVSDLFMIPSHFEGGYLNMYDILLYR